MKSIAFYIKNKISGHVDAKITKEQQPIATAIISAMSKNKNNEQRRR